MRMKRVDWNAVLETNLTSAYLCIQQVSTSMLKQRWGRIINIASVFGQMGQEMCIRDRPTALLPPVLNGPLLEEWKKFDIGCDMLVGVFERHNLPYLFSVDGATATVENISMPGFGAVGIYDKAMFWLSRRAQVLSMGVNRTAYHVYEAKLMGEGSPHVNEHIEFLIAAPDKYLSLIHI